MAIHKLTLDDVFDEVLYTLIAIHSGLEDYRLVYLMNKYLGVKLTRRTTDLDDSNTKSSYSIFEWVDRSTQKTWSLVSNICKIERYNESNYQSLFGNEKTVTTTYLLTEFKTVNYLLKIEGEFTKNEDITIFNSLLGIPQIVTAYTIDLSKLKSKDNLIFS